MRQTGARVLQASASQSANASRLVGGPIVVCGWSLTDGTAGQELENSGTQTAPPASTTIASLSLATGVYDVNWTVELTGTPGIADTDNVALHIGATVLALSSNLGAVGEYPQQQAQAVITGGPLTLSARAVGAGTAGAVYVVTLNVIPVGGGQATIRDGGMPIAYVNIPQGGVDTRWLDREGIDANTELIIQATQGTVSGVVWYRLGSDLEAVREHRHAEG
jgi:hypothetical protein